MSSAFSRKMQGVGSKLLGKFGSEVTLVRAGSKVWDAIKGEYIIGTTSNHALTAVTTPVSKNIARGISTFMDGTAIESGDMQIICDSKVVPSMDDKILFQGVEWSIVGLSPSVVNDDAVVYFILVRK